MEKEFTSYKDVHSCKRKWSRNGTQPKNKFNGTVSTAKTT